MPTVQQRRAFRDRLRDVIRTRYGSRARFASEVDLDENTIKRWLNPKAGLPNGGNLLQIALRTGLSPTWLLTGDGPELLGVTRTRAMMGEDLREELIARLATPYAKTALPPAERLWGEVLEEFTTRYQKAVDDLRDLVKRYLAIPYVLDPTQHPQFLLRQQFDKDCHEVGFEEAGRRLEENQRCPECGGHREFRGSPTPATG